MIAQSEAWYPIAVISIAQSLAAMSSNLLTLICIARFKYLRTGANLFVASLAVGDFLHGFVVGLGIVLVLTGQRAKFLCVVLVALEMISLHAQFINYLLLAAERQHSLHSLIENGKKWSKKTVCILISIGWALCLIWHIILVSTIMNSDSILGETCLDVEPMIPRWFTYTTYGFILITTSLICATYASIGLMVRKSNRQVTSHMPMAMQQQQRRKTSIRIASMMAMVFGVFVCLYCPFLIAYSLISPTSPPWFRDLAYVTAVIYDANFWINPFIYAWRDVKFKKAFKTILPRCCCNNSVNNDNNI